MENIFVQELKNYNSTDELKNIGFDKLYIDTAAAKYEYTTLKFFGLKAIESNILKQTALSVGSDCAVNRDVILNAEGTFDCIICASKATFLKIAEKLKIQQFRLKDIANEIINVFDTNNKKLIINNRTFDFEKHKYLMGILNITPDSFSDGGKYFDKDTASKQYFQLIEDGADIIDLGAQSTRPNYTEVSAEEEINRLKMLLENETIQNDKTPKSIDTYNYKVAEYALDNGVDIINDVHGFTDKNMIKLAAERQTPIVVMFNQKLLPDSTRNTFNQMYEFFIGKIDELISNGISHKNIIIDCGFGFFKHNEENVEMLKNLPNLKNLKCPILLGISRKSFFKYICDTSDKDELSALIAAKYIDYCSIIRVHNIKAHTSLKYI